MLTVVQTVHGPNAVGGARCVVSTRACELQGWQEVGVVKPELGRRGFAVVQKTPVTPQESEQMVDHDPGKMHSGSGTFDASSLTYMSYCSVCAYAVHEAGYDWKVERRAIMEDARGSY
jgi:hypothetical protein